MNKIAVIPHLGKPEVAEVARALVTWVAERGLTCLIPDEDASDLGVAGAGEDWAAECDLAVVLGGDGTILRAARLLGGREVPILGVNFGKFGFMTEVEAAGLYPALERVLAGDYALDRRHLLACRIEAGGLGSEARDFHAMNEIVIQRGYFERLIELEVEIEGKSFHRYVADGLILSTPTGSTAYSFSASGPIASPQARVYLVTPISPHSLFGRTLVLSDEETVVVTCPSFPRSGGVIIIDGVTVMEGEEFQRIEVGLSEKSVALVKLQEKTFYELLREKLRAWDRPGI